MLFWGALRFRQCYAMNFSMYSIKGMHKVFQGLPVESTVSDNIQAIINTLEARARTPRKTGTGDSWPLWSMPLVTAPQLLPRTQIWLITGIQTYSESSLATFHSETLKPSLCQWSKGERLLQLLFCQSMPFLLLSKTEVYCYLTQINH